MAINSLSSSIMKDIVSQANSSSSSTTDTSKIESEVASSGQTYTAQQLANKYNISLDKANKILEDIEKSKQKKTDKKDSADSSSNIQNVDKSQYTDKSSSLQIPDEPINENIQSSDVSTVSYLV